MILKELEPQLLALSKSSYGRFVVSKLVDLAPKEQLAGEASPSFYPCFCSAQPCCVFASSPAIVVSSWWEGSRPVILANILRYRPETRLFPGPPLRTLYNNR